MGHNQLEKKLEIAIRRKVIGKFESLVEKIFDSEYLFSVTINTYLSALTIGNA